MRGQASRIDLDRPLDVEQIGRHMRARLRTRRRYTVDGDDIEAVAREALDARTADASRASR